MVINSPLEPLILGIPWLAQHNPQIHWGSGKILSWGTTCLSSLKSAVVPSEPQESLETDFPDISKVPSCYLDLKEVFNKARATSLPPHRPYDCTIDLLPGTTPPSSAAASTKQPVCQSREM